MLLFRMDTQEWKEIKKKAMRKPTKQRPSDNALTDKELIEKYGDASVDFKEKIRVIVKPESGWQSQRRKKKKDK